MKKWTKLFSLAIGALMAIGAAVGVKQTAERLDAENKSETFTFSKYEAGTQYAKNEEHVLSDDVTIYTTDCHFTTELRIYSSTANNGYVCSNKIGVKINSVGFNAGKNADTLNVYGSSDGSTWSLVGGVVTKSAYADYAVDFTSKNYCYFKLDVAGTNQVRLKTLTLDYTTADGVNLSSITCDSIAMHPGEKNKPSLTFNPTNASNKEVELSIVSGASYIEIDDGFIVAKAAGEAVVKITPKDTNADSIDVNVVVSNYPESAFSTGKCFVLVATDSEGKKYELTGFTTNTNGVSYGVATAYTTIPSKTYQLNSVQGKYVNTIAFANSEGKFLYYSSSMNNSNALNVKDIENPDDESSWIIDVDPSNNSLFTIKNVANQNRLLQFSNDRFACYATQQKNVAFFEIDTTPRVTISSTDNATYFMAGNSLNFSKALENIAEPATVVWATSNTDKTSISSDGVLTAKSSDTICTTKVSCTVNGTKSNEIEITIWSNNKNIISLAKVIEIANFTSTTDTPYEYTTAGTVKSFKEGNSSEFVITDGDNDVTIFKSGNALEIGDYVEVSGCIKTNNSVPSIRSKVILNYYYTVTFMNNGVQHGTTLRVKSGEKIDKPTTPTPTGSKTIFAGWFNENIEWDFDTDVVVNNLTLVAKWSTGLDTLAQLNIKYNYNEAVLGQQYTDVLTSANFAATGTSYKDFSNVAPGASTAIYAGNTAKAASPNAGAIQMNSSKTSGVISTNSAGFVKSVSFTVASGSSAIDVYGSNEPYAAISDIYGASPKGTLIGSSTSTGTIVFDGEYEYFGLRPRGSAIYLTNITVVWDTGSPLTITNISEYNLRFSCELTADQIESSFGTPADWQCGFMVAQTTQMETTFEESYENLKDYFEISDNPIADVAAGAMETGTNAKISMYANTMDELPDEDMYEFSVNVKIPKANLESVVSAVWFAYNAETDEFVFASQKNMSVKDICGIYDDMELRDDQNAAIDYIIAQNGWAY